MIWGIPFRQGKKVLLSSTEITWKENIDQRDKYWPELNYLQLNKHFCGWGHDSWH